MFKILKNSFATGEDAAKHMVGLLSEDETRSAGEAIPKNCDREQRN
jgi:hypothetical protein